MWVDLVTILLLVTLTVGLATGMLYLLGIVSYTLLLMLKTPRSERPDVPCFPHPEGNPWKPRDSSKP